MSSLRKDFLSLRKLRYGGVLPHNLLSSGVKISVPTAHPVNRGTLHIVKPPAVSTVVPAQDVKTCFFLPIAIRDSGLAEPPSMSVKVRAINHNGSELTALYKKEYELRVAKDGEHMFVMTEFAYVDKMVIPRGTVAAAMFSDDLTQCLLVLEKRFGFFCLDFYEPEPQLRDLLRKNSWVQEHVVVQPPDKFHAAYTFELDKRRISQKDPETIVHADSPEPQSEPQSDHDDVLKNGLPSAPAPAKLLRRQTRSAAKLGGTDSSIELDPDERSIYFDGDDDEDEDLPVEHEEPAAFDPPLRHTLSNGKKFIIAYNDFKTLYNNDWINDTLIDFFIAFEMDHAVHSLQLARESDIHAFNSFFFTKLVSKADDQETPDCYGNIKRWLLKIDLMTYDSVIIPINEHLHWYCCVIKGLPELLKRAFQERDNPSELDYMEEKERKRPVAEFFFIDSLRQKHSNIVAPLVAMLKGYCKEKHGVDIDAALIRSYHARVPRQRNFNDCGIHVIYNIRKWLSEPATCETVWRRYNKGQRAYFSGVERNGMRKRCIEILLELHEKQPSDDSPKELPDKEGNHSDDEIELISYHSSKPEGTEEDGKSEKENGDVSRTATPQPANGGDTKADKSSKDNSREKSPAQKGQDEIVLSTPRRTLDPRVLESETKSPLSRPAGLFLQIEHPQIRRLCLRTRVKDHTIEFLNDFFSNHSKVLNEEKQKLVLEFVDKYNFFDPVKEKMQCEILTRDLSESLKVPAAPMDEPFVIQEEDSGGELNRSVGDLRISGDEPRRLRKKANNTPEATRSFLRKTEEMSPLTRRNKKLASSDSFSELEIIHNITPNGLCKSERNKKSPDGRSEPTRGPPRIEAVPGTTKLSSSEPEEEVIALREVVTISDDEDGRQLKYMLWSSPKRRRVEEKRTRHLH